MLKQLIPAVKKLSREAQKKIAGGRVVCHNIPLGGSCGSSACWLATPTRCCCAET